MNKIISALAAVSLVLTGFAALLFVPVAPAAAAQSFLYTCEAKSPSATGWGQSNNLDTACRRALYECAVLTPSYQTCYTNRWWYNY